MKNFIYILLFTVLLILGLRKNKQDANFEWEHLDRSIEPLKYGFGRNTTGGIGGTVYTVTNLNTSGTGSLREAIEASGTRIIKFAVSGTIDFGFNEYLKIDNGNVTIDGSDAPNGGICLKNCVFKIRASNVILRHLRLRYGETVNNRDCLGINPDLGDVSNVLIDHCSMSWGSDELFEIWLSNNNSVSNVTLQYCIFSECLDVAPEYPKAVLLGGGDSQTGTITNVSFYKCYFAHNIERHIRIKQQVQSVEMVNCVIYNWHSGFTATHGAKFDVVNNHFKKGHQTTNSQIVKDTSDTSGTYVLADTLCYVTGNTNDSDASEMDAQITSRNQGGSVVGSLITPDSVANAITDVLANAGATLPKRDAVDARVILDYTNVTGDIFVSPENQNNRGGYPDITI